MAVQLVPPQTSCTSLCPAATQTCYAARRGSAEPSSSPWLPLFLPPHSPAVLQGAGQLQRPVERPPVTEPAPFMFVTDDRAERRRKRDAPEHGEEQHQHAFKAQALDRSILEGPVSGGASRSGL